MQALRLFWPCNISKILQMEPLTKPILPIAAIQTEAPHIQFVVGKGGFWPYPQALQDQWRSVLRCQAMWLPQMVDFGVNRSCMVEIEAWLSWGIGTS